MRNSSLFPFLIFFCSSIAGYSQSRPQVRLKMGAVQSIVLPGNAEGYAYKIRSTRGFSADFTLEYSQAIKNKSISWFAGIALDPQGVRVSLNRSNFQSFDNDPEINADETTFRFYSGIGKKIGGGELKNHFTVFGGLGFAVNFESHRSGTGSLTGSEGITKNGEFFKSRYSDFILRPGFQTWVYVGREFRITPTIFSGIRWQRVNRKGNDGLGLELLGNFGLAKYFEYKVPYTLDGVDHEDSFSEFGNCVQLNLIIPLWNFGKKK